MALQIGAMEIVLRTDLQQFTSGIRAAESAVTQSSARMSRATDGAARSVSTLERAMGNIHGADSFRALTISALRTEDSLSRLKSVALLIPSALGGISVALSARALMGYADTMTTVRNRLAVVIDSQEDRIAAEREIFAISQRTRSQVSATANLYARTSQAAESLGRSQGDILKFTEAVQKTNIISGSTTQEASAGAIQLAQGLASGRLQGDELRSILENNLELSNILARELAGGDKGRLRELGSEGALNANAVLDAVLKNLDRIDRKFSQTQPTIAQGFVLIDNAIASYVGHLDQAFGATASFVKLLTSMSESVPELASALSGLGAFAAAIFAGRAIGGAVRSASGVISVAREDLRQNSISSLQEALAAQRAKETAQLRLAGAGANMASAKGSLFAAADPEAVRAYAAAKSAQDRTNARLSAEIAERSSLASNLERVNRQIAGAERALNQTIAAEAPQSARGLRSYFQSAFKVEGAKADLAALQNAIVAAKRDRDGAVLDLSKSLIEGDSRSQRLFEKSIAQREAGIARLEARIPSAVESIAAAERAAAAKGVSAVEEAEARKSAAINRALQDRAKLVKERAGIEAKLSGVDDRVGALRTTQMFADSAVTKAGGLVEETAQTGLIRRQNEYNAAKVAATAADGAHAAAVGRLESAYSRMNSALATAGNAAARLGSSFMAFVGGPWGLAFTGLSVALGYLAYRQVEAANTADRHKRALDDLPSAIERVNAAIKEAQFNGTDPSRVLVDEKAKLQQAQEAAKGKTQEFFSALQQVAGVNAVALAQILRDAFRIDIPRGGSILGVIDEIQRAGPPTAQQIQQVERAIQALAVSGGLNPKVAVDISKAGEEARRTADLVSTLERAVSNLDGSRARIDIIWNVTGLDLDPSRRVLSTLTPRQQELYAPIPSEEQINKIREEGTNIADKRRAAEEKLQTELRKRIDYSRLSKDDRRIEELRDQYPTLTRDQARGILTREDAQSKAGKKGPGKSSEEKFDDRVKLLEAQGRAAFLNDRYRELIDQLKTLKSDPSLAEETLKAIEAGTALPEKAAKILSAMDLKRAGEIAREAKEQYGSFADAIAKVEERQRLLTIAVQQGSLTQAQAAESLAGYVASLPQFSFLNKTTDAIGDIAKQAGLAATGFQSWNQALQNVRSAMVNLALDEFLVRPMKDAIRTLLASGLTGGGGNQNGGGAGIFGSVLGSLFGGGGAASPTPAIGGLYHDGGNVGAPSQWRALPASAWAGAPRFHSGLNVGEHRAILQYGERVLTSNDARRTDRAMLGLASQASKSAGPASMGPSVVIKTDPSIEVKSRRETSDSQGASGEEIVLGIVEKGTSQGRLDQVFRSRYGNRPTAVRR